MSRIKRRLTLTHTQRWHQHRHTVGEGHVYQGRFKSFPVETSEYFLTLCRYVERNQVAGFGERVEQLRWSSAKTNGAVPLHAWPMERPADWFSWVNKSEPTEQLSMVRRSVLKGQPYGSARWVVQMVTQWHLGATLRGRGRPKKELAKNGS